MLEQQQESPEIQQRHTPSANELGHASPQELAARADAEAHALLGHEALTSSQEEQDRIAYHKMETPANDAERLGVVAFAASWIEFARRDAVSRQGDSD